jgi:hypothetical protein
LNFEYSFSFLLHCLFSLPSRLHVACMLLAFFSLIVLSSRIFWFWGPLFFISLFHYPLTCIFFFLIILVLVCLLVLICIGNFHGLFTPLLHYDYFHIVVIISQLLATIFLMIFSYFLLFMCFVVFFSIFIYL